MRISDPGWTARRSRGTYILQAGLLRNVPWLVHGFSTRVGLDRWDSPKSASANREKIAAALGGAKMPLASLRQVHSDFAQLICGPLPSTPVAGDAAMTSEAGMLVSVQTADCVPILLVDTKRRAVAAVHAGWRGTLARIVVKTLGRMQQEFGTRPGDVVAALGPAIGPCCYEVGPEVAREFMSQFSATAEWFDGPFDRVAWGEEPNPMQWLNMMPPGHQPEPPRVNLDLRAANRWQLIDAGVSRKRIASSTLCTRCREDLFYSYRRDGAGTGRMIAAIGVQRKTR